MDAAGKLEQVGKWNTLVSVLPMKYCVVADEPLVVPPDDEFPEEEPFEEPPEIVPEPDPVLSLEPFGKVSVTPFVENTTFPFLSVR